jgi:hypothetical protein
MGTKPPDRGGGGLLVTNMYERLNEEEAGPSHQNNNNNNNKRNKRKFSPWEHSPTLFDDKNRMHEGKYVMIETTTAPALTEYSMFTVETILKFVAPGYVSADKIRGGKILLLTKDKQSAEKALLIKNIPNLCNINVTLHNDLNRIQGSIYSEDLMKEDLEKLQTELKKKNVVEIRRVTRRENEEIKDTPLHILTFECNSLEPTIKIGWMSFPLRKYYPSPLRCSKCLVLGHTKKNCSETIEYCRGCAMERHPGNCTRKACRNCPKSNDHSTNDPDCPKSAEEKAIIQIKTDQKIPYFKAKLEFRKRQQKAAQNAEITAQIQEQQMMYRNKTYAQITNQDENVQQQILKTLMALQEKIEKLEGIVHSSPQQPEKSPKTKPKTTEKENLSSEQSDDMMDQSKLIHTPLAKATEYLSEDHTNIVTQNDSSINLTSITNHNLQQTPEQHIAQNNTQKQFFSFEHLAQQQAPTLLQLQQQHQQQQQQQQKYQQLQKQNDNKMEYEDEAKGIKRPIQSTLQTAPDESTTTPTQQATIGNKKKYTTNIENN